MQVTGGREGLKAVEREVLMKVGDSTNAGRTSILAVADTLYCHKSLGGLVTGTAQPDGERTKVGRAVAGAWPSDPAALRAARQVSSCLIYYRICFNVISSEALHLDWYASASAPFFGILVVLLLIRDTWTIKNLG